MLTFRAAEDFYFVHSKLFVVLNTVVYILHIAYKEQLVQLDRPVSDALYSPTWNIMCT